MPAGEFLAAPSRQEQAQHAGAATTTEHDRSPLDQIPVWAAGKAIQRSCTCEGETAIQAAAAVSVSRPDDRSELEAGRVADEVLAGGAPTTAAGPVPGASPRVGRISEGAPTAPAAHTSTSFRVPRGGGQPLPPATRQFFESRLGAGFGDVRLHTDTHADALSRTVRALAFTTGNDIFFRTGQFQPESRDGVGLLAHELTHVIQQSGSGSGSRSSTGLVQRCGDHVSADCACAGEADTIQRLPDPAVPMMMASGSERLCFPPSAVTDPQFASGFGTLAERLIENDYCDTLSCAPGTTYVDNVNPTAYLNFMRAHNPSLTTAVGIAALAVASATGIARPDIMCDDGSRRDYYEIKPLSPSGATDGLAKLASIALFMSTLGLPYVPGVTYTPSKDIPILSGMVVGEPISVALNVQRFVPGLVTYSLCLEGNLSAILAKMTMLALMAWIAVQLLPLVAGGAVVLA